MRLKLTKPLIVFDLETTGLDLVNDRIIQISYIKVMPSGEELRESFFVNPGRHIPAEVEALTGISDGDVASAKDVLDNLGVRSVGAKGYEWGTAENTGTEVTFSPEKTEADLVPNVKGMGARDAVYALTSHGMKVRIRGRGKVEKQSVEGGKKIVLGQTVTLELN